MAPPPWSDRLSRGALLATAFLYSAGYATAGLVLLLGAAVAEGIATRRIPWCRSPLDGWLALFIGGFLVSGFLSPFRTMAVASTGLAALTIYLAYGGLRRALGRDPGFLLTLTTAWLAGGALAALWAIARHLQTGPVATTPALGQNAVGTVTIITVVLGAGLVLSTRGAVRLWTLAATLLGVTALLFTYSRGAWLGGLTALGLLAVLAGRRARAGVAIAALLVLAGGAAAARGEWPAIAARARSIVNPAVNRDRISLLRSGLAIFRAHPVLGTGLNTFPLVYPRYRQPGDINPPDARPNAHNIYLNMAAEGGLLGAAAFLGLLAAVLRRGPAWVAAGRDRAFRASLLAAFVGILVHQLFDGTLLSVHLGAGMWMLMAVLTMRPD